MGSTAMLETTCSSQSISTSSLPGLICTACRSMRCKKRLLQRAPHGASLFHDMRIAHIKGDPPNHWLASIIASTIQLKYADPCMPYYQAMQPLLMVQRYPGAL